MKCSISSAHHLSTQLQVIAELYLTARNAKLMSKHPAAASELQRKAVWTAVPYQHSTFPALPLTAQLLRQETRRL